MGCFQLPGHLLTYVRQSSVSGCWLPAEGTRWCGSGASLAHRTLRLCLTSQCGGDSELSNSRE